MEKFGPIGANQQTRLGDVLAGEGRNEAAKTLHDLAAFRQNLFISVTSHDTDQVEVGVLVKVAVRQGSAGEQCFKPVILLEFCDELLEKACMQ